MRAFRLVLAGWLLLPGLARAAPDDGLDADEIYRRVLANRFTSSDQDLTIVSADRAGREQDIRMRMLWRRYPDGSEEEKDGVLSRTLVRYTHPSDMRRTGYLIVNKRDAPNDQFVYLHSMRRVRRVNLKSETVAGTDLSMEDIVPREMDDARYVRISDEEVDGTPCFVVEATPVPDAGSQYSKFRLYVEKAHYVPLRIRYWDGAGVEIKELRSSPGAIREFDGIYVPMQSTMRDLLRDGHTRLVVDRLEPGADIPEKSFTVRQLQAKRLR